MRIQPTENINQTFERHFPTGLCFGGYKPAEKITTLGHFTYHIGMDFGLDALVGNYIDLVNKVLYGNEYHEVETTCFRMRRKSKFRRFIDKMVGN